MKKFQKTRKDLEEIDIPLSTNSYKAISHKTLIDLTLESAWATIWHPMGFKVEIYLSDFLRIIQKNDIHKGELIGAFKWQENKLIKHEL